MSDKSSSESGIIKSCTLNLPFDNIDTDQIIPAQFLTTTDREGLGKFCFHHWRFHPDGTRHEGDPLADHDSSVHQVLVAGTNFGCGSSREHAPWALLDLGFKAVISTRFADIFRNNSLKNGLLLITVEQDVIDFLMDHPHHEVHIDILAGTLTIDGFGQVDFPLEPFSAYCLAEGIDQLDFILRQEADIARYEQRINH